MHTKLLLVRGHCGNAQTRALDGKLIVTHDKGAFPQTSWNVHDGEFKVLVHLSPGPNKIRLDFYSQKLADNKGTASLHYTYLNVNYLPMNNSPPLRLALLVANDSKYVFDTSAERMQSEGNDISLAVKKYRVAAQLWQTFTAEKMSQMGLGRRTFRLEEEYTMSTLSSQDQESSIMRNEPVVSIVQMDKTTEEIRLMSESQLLQASIDALHQFLRPYPEQIEHVAAMLLDSHWDPMTRQLTGHSAMAGGDKNIKVALYGSQALHAYPSCIEEVTSAFEDSTRLSSAHVGNVDGAIGSSWEAVNAALWGHMREISRVFGCEEQSTGMMCPKQPPRFSRMFVTNESFCTAEQRKGLRPVMESDELGWSLLDLLRFRSHPCFRIPLDPPPVPDCEIQFWPLHKHRLYFHARNGITFIEVFGEGDKVASLVRNFLLATNKDGVQVQSRPPNSFQISEQEIRAVLPKDKAKGRLRVVAHSAGTARSEITDLAALFEDRKVKISGGQKAYRSPRLGKLNVPSAEVVDLVLSNASEKMLLQSIKIYCDNLHIYGLEFMFEGLVSQMFGSKGNPGAGTVDIAKFELGMLSLFQSLVFANIQTDSRNTEVLSGFHVRVGPSGIAGLRITTSHSRFSQWYGKQSAVGGYSDHTLIPPAGFTIAGVSGSVWQSLVSFSVLVKM